MAGAQSLAERRHYLNGGSSCQAAAPVKLRQWLSGNNNNAGEARACLAATVAAAAQHLHDELMMQLLLPLSSCSSGGSTPCFCSCLAQTLPLRDLWSTVRLQEAGAMWRWRAKYVMGNFSRQDNHDWLA